MCRFRCFQRPVPRADGNGQISKHNGHLAAASASAECGRLHAAIEVYVKYAGTAGEKTEAQLGLGRIVGL